MTIEDAQIVHTRQSDPFSGYEQSRTFIADVAGCKSIGGMAAPDATLVMMRGREIGLPPATALLGVHIIGGKPSLSARAKVAACLRHKEICEYFEEISASDTEATYETKRVGSQRVQRETFTIAEAERAKLIERNPTWKAYPKAMLRARCMGALADRVYADILLGYATEEVERDMSPATAPAGYVQPAVRMERGTLVAVESPRPQLEPAPTEADAPWRSTPAFDTAGYLARFAAATSEAEVEAIALDLSNADPDDAANAALLPAYEAAQLRVACLSESDWTAHLAAKDVTFEVANSLFKRAAAFEAAGVLDARTALAEARLEALGIPDPGAFLNAMYARRAA